MIQLVSGNSFRWCVLAATLLPLVVAFGMQVSPLLGLFPSVLSSVYSNSITTVFVLMGTLSSAHVFSTTYLLLNPKEYAGVKNASLMLVLLPILLIAALTIACRA